MAQTGSLITKDEFRNTSDGYVGVTIIGPHGEHRGAPVDPHGSVFLSEDEQILTANAPRDDTDNPFLPQPYEVFDDKGEVTETGERPLLVLVRKGTEVRNRRPLGVALDEDDKDDAIEEETGATPAPQDEPEVGEAAPGEEVATPTAARRRRSKAPVG